jgi:hypothetical protein
MARTFSILVWTLSLSGLAAQANALEMIEGAYELSLREVSLPRSAVDAASFRPCEGCSTVSLSVDSATRYSIDGRELVLADFLQAIERIRQGPDGNAKTFVGLFYDLKTDRVTRVLVSRPGA